MAKNDFTDIKRELLDKAKSGQYSTMNGYKNISIDYSCLYLMNCIHREHYFNPTGKYGTSSYRTNKLDEWEKQMRTKYVLSSDKFDSNLYEDRIADEEKESLYYDNLINNAEPTLHCPTCNSTNVKSISGLSRGASIAMLGIFSKKINKSFECKNCGYTW